MRERANVSDHDKRVLLAGVAVVLAIGSLRGVPWYVRTLRQVRARTELADTKLVERRTLASQAPAISRSASLAQRRILAFAPAFIPGNTPPAASASLASHVSSVARAAGVSVGTLDVHADTDTSEIGHVILRGEATADVRGLTTFLAALEGGVPILDVRELTIAQAAPDGPDNQPEALHVAFTVHALAHYMPRADQ